MKNSFEMRALHYVERIRVYVLKRYTGPHAELIADACAKILKEFELLWREQDPDFSDRVIGMKK